MCVAAVLRVGKRQSITHHDFELHIRARFVIVLSRGDATRRILEGEGSGVIAVTIYGNHYYEVRLECGQSRERSRSLPIEINTNS